MKIYQEYTFFKDHVKNTLRIQRKYLLLTKITPHYRPEGHRQGSCGVSEPLQQYLRTLYRCSHLIRGMQYRVL